MHPYGGCNCLFGLSTVKLYSAQNGNSMRQAGRMPDLRQMGPCTLTMGHWWPLISSTCGNEAQNEIITEVWSGVLATSICGHLGPGRQWCPLHGWEERLAIGRQLS